MTAAIFIHIGLGLVLGILFAAAVLAKAKRDRQQEGTTLSHRIGIYAQNILLVGIAFVVLIWVMKFVRDYEPRSWINLAALIVTWIISGYACWRLIFRIKLHKSHT